MSQFTVFSACFGVSALIAGKSLQKISGLAVREKVITIQPCADEQPEHHKNYEVCQWYESNSVVKAQGNISFHVLIVKINKKDCCPYTKGE